MGFDQKIAELNLELPPPPKPVGSYSPCVQVGNMLYLSGHVPLKPDKTIIEGKVGVDLTLEQAVAAARTVGLTMIATVRAHLGSLDRVNRVVKVLGVINCVDGFRDQPKVMNGFSDLMVEIFGEQGRAARSAIGTNALPLNVPVEVEAIMEIKS